MIKRVLCAAMLLGLVGCAVEAATGLSSNGCLLKPGAQCAGVTTGFTSATDLSRTNWTGANLSGTSFGGAKMTAMKLNGAILDGANLTNSVMTQTILQRASCIGTNFTSAYLYNVSAQNGVYKNANFTTTSMVKPGLVSYYNFGDFSGAIFTGTIAGGGVFDFGSFAYAAIDPTANFAGSSFKNVNFNNVTVGGGANFTNSDLTEASFKCATLSTINVSGATLEQTNFFNADVSKVVEGTGKGLSKTNYPQALYCNTKIVNGGVDNSDCPPNPATSYCNPCTSYTDEANCLEAAAGCTWNSGGPGVQGCSFASACNAYSTIAACQADTSNSCVWVSTLNNNAGGCV